MIPCKCIDDKNKPSIIPDELWVKEGETYHITHVYQMADRVEGEIKPRGIQGCDLKELDISAYIPTTCFRLDRFAFKLTDLEKLIQMMKDCTDLNEADISELTELLEVDREIYEEQEF